MHKIFINPWVILAGGHNSGGAGDPGGVRAHPLTPIFLTSFCFKHIRGVVYILSPDMLMDFA